MHHIQRIKLLPGPGVDARLLAQFREARDGKVRGRGQQLIVGLVSDWEPFRGAVG